ncbi:chaperonin 10-like protein [Fusarium redolens]|uniref:Chaperonin 10-like protein n=1 Tax=Fusarium redolens TaxID=48865 RepID=A0A9P9JKB0_FUSRE|nr:chaperonin 10-like protein [Fusarium redolens]KAH7207842.1 chaperonin 10-like protein [Fusarium redolens]
MAVEHVKASVLHSPKELRLEERELPNPASNEDQIAVQSTGLGGPDLHYYSHFRNGDIIVREPLTLDHGSAGTIISVGSEVTCLKPGDHVALEFRSSAKATPHAQGTLQWGINHPAKWCHKMPDHITLDLGALVEPLSVAMHARDRAALPKRSTVLILGAGAVGLLAAAIVKVDQAKTVIIADILKDRLDFATANGFADASVLVPMERPQTMEDKLTFDQTVAALVKETRANGEAVGEVTAVYQCTGVETSWRRGEVMIIGMGTPVLTIPISAAAHSEVDIVGVFRYANTYKDIIELLANPPANMPDVIRHPKI